MARDLNEIMWQKFVNGLCASSAGKGLDPAALMPTGGLNNADWEVMDITGLPPAGPNPPSHGSVIVPALEKWTNVMPEWKPVYTPSFMNFYDQYTAFLNSIALKGGNPALQQIADGYATNMTTARKKLSADQAEMYQAWSAFNTAQASIPPSAQMSFTQWYNQNWSDTITADTNNLSAQSLLFNQAMAKVGGPDYQTISGAMKAAELNPMAGNALTGPSGVALPAYTITPGLNDWYVSVLQTLSSGSKPAIEFTISLNDSDSSKISTSSYLNAATAVSYRGFCWGGKASASYSQSKGAQEYDSLVNNLTMTYSAQAATIFDITVGNWFNSSIVADFYDQISPTSALANKQLFGENGVLNLRCSRLLVVLKPSITLKGDKTQISTLATQFQQQSAASVSVGAFCWSASASVSQGQSRYTQDVKQSTDGTSITMTDNTNAPKVIAVMPAVLK